MGYQGNLVKEFDSRLKPQDRNRKQVVGPHGLYLDRVFCSNCYKDSGISFVDSTHILYVCQDCTNQGVVLPFQVMDEAAVEQFKRNGG
jgi:hypothetical protein